MLLLIYNYISCLGTAAQCLTVKATVIGLLPTRRSELISFPRSGSSNYVTLPIVLFGIQREACLFIIVFICGCVCDNSCLFFKLNVYKVYRIRVCNIIANVTSMLENCEFEFE